MVVNFRKINEQLEYWSYLLMRTDRIFSKLHRAKLFFTVDVQSAYYNITVDEIIENTQPSQQDMENMMFSVSHLEFM